MVIGVLAAISAIKPVEVEKGSSLVNPAKVANSVEVNSRTAAKVSSLVKTAVATSAISNRIAALDNPVKTVREANPVVMISNPARPVKGVSSAALTLTAIKINPHKTRTQNE